MDVRVTKFDLDGPSGELIRFVAESLTCSEVTVDAEDVKRLFAGAGDAYLCSGEGDVSVTCEAVARFTAEHSVAAFSRCLCHIETGVSVTLLDVQNLTASLVGCLSEECEFVWGCAVNSDLPEDFMKFSVMLA